MPSRAPRLETRLRFPDSKPDAFGPGKADLLEHIEATGSIRKAASKMGMSYNRAWLLVRSMNQRFKEPLVISERGGETGGGASLTPLGREVLTAYRRMQAACEKACRKDWESLRRHLK